MKKLMTLLFALLASNVFAATNYDVEFSCVIEGHGGGCGTEYVKLESIQGADLSVARITEEDCYEDEHEDFCHTTTISEYKSKRTDLLKLAFDKRDDGLLLKRGLNKVRVNIYDDEGFYITTHFVNINASSVTDY